MFAVFLKASIFFTVMALYSLEVLRIIDNYYAEKFQKHVTDILETNKQYSSHSSRKLEDINEYTRMIYKNINYGICLNTIHFIISSLNMCFLEN